MVVQSATDARAQIIEEQFWSVVANIPGAVYRCACVDDWPIRFISDYIELLCGYPAADFVDNAVRTYGSIIHPHDRPYVAEEIDRALEVGAPYALQYRVLHADGGLRWISERGRAILGESGERLWLDGVLLDVTDQVLAEQDRDRAEAALRQQAEVNRHQALHDSLTESAQPRPLPGSRPAGDPQRAARGRRGGRTGHGPRPLQGDQRHARPRQRRPAPGGGGATPAHDAAGRRLDRAPGRRRVRDPAPRRLAQRASPARRGASRTAFAAPFSLDGLPLQIEASIGAATYPEHADDVEGLIQRADIAMYVAKRDNSGWELYDRSQDGHQPQRLSLISELRRAIDERELVLHYQPKLELRSGQVAGGGGARALAAPDARARRAQRVHRRRPGDEPDQAAHALRDRRGAAPVPRLGR